MLRSSSLWIRGKTLRPESRAAFYGPARPKLHPSPRRRVCYCRAPRHLHWTLEASRCAVRRAPNFGAEFRCFSASVVQSSSVGSSSSGWNISCRDSRVARMRPGGLSTSVEVYALNCSNPARPQTAGLKQAYATVLVASLPEQIGALTH